MATQEEVYSAIRAADAAGDGDSVRKLGAYLQTMQKPEATATPDLSSKRALTLPSGGGGIGDAMLALGSGAIAAPVSGLAGIAGAVLPGPSGQSKDWVTRTQDALTYQPRTQLGGAITSAVAYPFQKLAEGADVVGGKVAESTGLPSLGAATNTAIQSLPMLIGKGSARVAPGGETAGGIAARDAARIGNAQSDAALVAARDAGYKVPPTQANPSLVNQVIEGFGGKIKTAQNISEKNQPVSNALIRDNFGLAPDAPLTIDTLSGVRRDAGAAYEPVRAAGRITPGADYFSALDNIAAPYAKAASDFPKAAKTDVISAVDSVRVPSFDAGSAVDQIRIMRDNADSAYRGGDKALGGAYKGIAKALEDAIDKHLTNSGAPPDIIDNYRNARQTIAQTYTVQKYLRPNGNIDVQGLAGELGKKPLTGNIATVANFGANFRKAAQVPEKIGGVPMGPLDYLTGLGSIGGAIVSGHPALLLGAATPFLRTGARSLLASDKYQQAMAGPANYGPTLGNKMLALQQEPLMQLLQMSEAQRKRNGLLDIANP